MDLKVGYGRGRLFRTWVVVRGQLEVVGRVRWRGLATVIMDSLVRYGLKVSEWVKNDIEISFEENRKHLPRISSHTKEINNTTEGVAEAPWTLEYQILSRVAKINE